MPATLKQVGANRATSDYRRTVLKASNEQVSKRNRNKLLLLGAGVIVGLSMLGFSLLSRNSAEIQSFPAHTEPTKGSRIGTLDEELAFTPSLMPEGDFVPHEVPTFDLEAALAVADAALASDGVA